MNSKIYDCAIIGGGLAGLTLAVQLANSGRSVILFEKENYPFHKVCGEYISMESYDFLDRIGIPLQSMKLPMINELKISSPNGNYLSQKLDLGGFGISRFTLDFLLAELAVSKGVTLIQGTKVIDVEFDDDVFRLKTEQQVFTSKLVCGSFGKRSVLDKKLRKNKSNSSKAIGKNYIGVKYHIKVDFPDNRIELHNFKGGYCGISKVDDEKYCLCYLTDSKNLRDSDNDIKKMEETILMKNPFLKSYFENAAFIYDKPLTISQITFEKKSAIENHVLLLGDAAGTIAPLCGNGMSMAMHSSFLAFPMLEKYLDGTLTRQALESAYNQQWQNHFATRIKAGRFIQNLFGGETLTNLVIGLFKKMPFVTDRLIRLTHGKRF